MTNRKPIDQVTVQDIEAAVARLNPRMCGATFQQTNGEQFVCTRPTGGWFPGIHRTREGQRFGRWPLLGGAWTGKKPTPK